MWRLKIKAEMKQLIDEYSNLSEKEYKNINNWLES